MTSARHLKSAADWCDRIDGISDQRCDLEMLLKDEWRHRVAVRDDDPQVRATHRRELVVDGQDYAALTEVLAGGDLSLGAFALTALHSVLHAYGHGHQTVVAFLDATRADPRAAGVLPVVVDHVEQADLACAEAVGRIDDAVRRPSAYLAQPELLQRGLFDALLVLVDREVGLTDLPPSPLVAVVRDDAAGGRLVWTMAYAGELFEDKIVAGVLDVAREVLGHLLHRPGQLVADIDLVSTEQELRLHQWNGTDGDFPADKRLNQLFEDAARRGPDREAVVFDEVQLTYREVDERSNQLAHWLLGAPVHVRPQELVGLYLDKSDHGVVATFGMWKAGAAYVPIDPAYPAERIRFLVADTGLNAIVTSTRHAERLREVLGPRHAGVHVVEVDALFAEGGAALEQPRENPDLPLGSQDLAYVTYTSGTTGVPKGVPKYHDSVVNSITDLSERYDMLRAGTERVALFASYVFEPHLRQTLIALINSQTLVIVPDEVRLDPDRFPEYIERHGVTYLNATGSVLQHFDLRRCPSLTRLLLVGEELTAAGLQRLRERFDGRVVNEYAFTEAAFVTAVKEFAPGVGERPDRSIGRPLRNVKWYVLSQGLKQLPIGAIGELYIGGRGVAPGYLNRDDLTAERFTANPFQTERDRELGQNGRLYKTGDLARVLPTGEVEFMGRSDFQLKLNGVRVEPGEIEARATEFPGVRKCVVVAREGTGGAADRHLVGFYVTEDSAEVTEDELLAHLGERLIRIMVPARMVRVASIPVNVNGKVDWRALPEVGPRESAAPAEDRPVAGVAGRLREIWSQVLGVPAARIGAEDDFFRLGGQSISCILLIAKVRQRLRVSVGVDDVFTLRTLGEQARFLEQQVAQGSDAAADAEQAVADAPTGGEPTRLLANGLQQGLLYHALKSVAGDDAYVMQSVHHYRCAIDPDRMREAWQHARQRYPSLRLRFEWAGAPVQVVDNDDEPFDWRFTDLTDLTDLRDEAEQDARVRELQERDRTEPYDPAAGRLFRVYLIKQRDDLFSLIFSCHHIILDGWSLPVLHDEVHRAYLRLLDGLPVESTPDTAYLAAQRYWEDHRGDHTDYWVRQVERIDERGDFAGLLNERSRYRVGLGNYDHIRDHRTRTLGLGARRTAALKAVCAADRVTLHSVLQFVWHKVLYAIGGGNTTVVGTIVSGRNVPVDAVEASVGLFINTLPLVVDHDDQATKSVADAVRDIQSTVNTMNSKSVVELGRLQRGEMKRRLFDTLLVLENYPRLLDEAEEREHQERLSFEKAYDADNVDYPLAVVAREEGDELTVTLWYAGELFDDSAIDTLLDLTELLFQQVIDDISGPVADLGFASPTTLATFDRWNSTAEDFPADKTLHGVFEEMAERWPDEIALVHNKTRLTYREFNERANQLAHHLRSVAELRPNEVIALVLDKSELMIIAIFAAWKTGAAYVPIDTGYPDDRVAFMVEDTDARIVLTNQAHGDRLRSLAPGRPVLEVEALRLDGQPRENPVTATTSTDLAYAIYTSGTTGKPKAVLLEHRGVVNLQSSLATLFSLRKEDGDEALLSFSNYIFDHFIEQMTDALLNGQKLVVLDDTMRTDEARLCRYMNDEQVTYLSGTPSVLSLYDYSAATSLTRVDAIGEDFTEPVFNKIRGTFPGTIINGYGPTEVSITSHKRPYPPEQGRVNKSIGHPVGNTKVYVLNREMKLIPVGGIGELYLGGIGVARGYLNREDLTAERFLDNPFQTEEEARLGENARVYKTGDLVRWLPNGEIEYLGRTDLQVKIRGQRVELGEVEAALTSFPGVRRSLVIAREHRMTASAVSQKYLAGFYVADDEFDEQDLKRWMRKTLPESVVPARVVRILDIPVTPSGKLDTHRLPETDFGPGDGVRYVGPSTDVEIKLCGIWSRVLEVAPDLVGVHDDFFALGGDSIRAMALAQAITTGFGGGLGVTTVLQHTTLAAQAAHIQETAAARDAEASEPATGRAAAHEQHPPVSLAQERLLFIDDFEGGTAAYNIPFALRVELDDRVGPDAVVAALRTLVRRHPALRTLLRTGADGVRRQHVVPPVEAVGMLELTTHAVDSTAELDRLLVELSEHVFRLHEELPIRVRLCELGTDPGAAQVGLVIHHSAFDGWSWGLFRRELAELLGGTPESALPGIRGSYGDFAVWQRQYLTEQRLSALTDFWTEALRGFDTIKLPLDHPRPPQFDYRGRELEFALDAATAEALRELAQSARVSLYSVLLGAWSLVLAMYTGQHDVVVGTPSANRGRPEFDRTVGFFANLLALRVRVDHGASVRDHVRAVGEAVIAAQVHGELPFEQLVKELAVVKDPSRHPILQVNFTLQNVTDRVEPPEDAPAVAEYKPDSGGWTSTKFDLSATLSETPDGLAGNLTYAASLFDDTTAAGIVETFRHVLAEFARLSATGDRTALSAITPVDRDRAAPAGAPVEAPAPARTLHSVFEEAAARTPDAVAVVHGDTRLTYGELDERANRLAHHLRSVAEVRPGDLVALVIDRDELVVVAILAVWKSGAGYLPVDPGYPDERVDFMLSDTGARLVLAGGDHGARVRELPAASALPVVDLDRVVLDEHPGHAPENAVTSGDLAYAIYTSGTTGRPKAVLVAHRSVDSFRTSLVHVDDDAADRTVLLLSNHVFDFSVEQLALSVLSGAKLIVPPPDPAGDDAFYDLADREGLSYLSGTPTQVERLDLARLPHLRTVLVAGEAFQERHFDKIRSRYGGVLFNAYGTTETSVYNTVERFEPGAGYRNSLGEPLANTRLHVLGDGMRLLPAGAVGELYVAGECVTEGYLNRSELTAERFLANPFQTDAERAAGRFGVLYRTGDLVRRGPGGDLRHQGRADAQLKINGLRVEPGEVEAALGSCDGVRQCAVVAGVDERSPDRKRLVAYYVPEDGAVVDEAAVLRALRGKLIPGMVPSLLVRLDQPLPMTVNGKVDTAALPGVDFGARRTAYAAPRDRVEARLCHLWGAQLGGGSVGIDDDFFRSGGDSISALHLASQVQREVGRKLSVKHVFDHPTVRQFADAVLAAEEGPDDGRGHAEQGRLSGPCPTLPVQDWFFAKSLPEPAHWNQTFAIRTPELDVAVLRGALDRLVEHHDAFRLRFRGGEQFYGDGDPGVVLHELDLRGLSEEDLHRQLARWQSGFDLEHGPTGCAAYLHGFEDGSARVWFAVHHLAVDSVSWHILAQDLEILHHGGDLGEKTASYRQWARAVRDHEPDEGERRAWAEVVRAMADDALPAAGATRHHAEFALDAAETRMLLTESTWAYDTEVNDLLLTATGYALSSITGRAGNHVTVEGHGRELFDGAPDVRATVGWFTTMHPVAVEAHPDDLARGILATRANRRRVPHHGIGYGALHPGYDAGGVPLPAVTFNYLGRLDDGEDATAPGWSLDSALCGGHSAEGNEVANDSAVDVTVRCTGGRLVAEVDSRWDEATTRRFADELRRWLGRVVEHTTGVARAGATAAGERRGADAFDPYILVDEDAEPTIFVLPPGEGGAESYLNNIAKNLPGHRLVLFNNVHLHSPMGSFEELAEYYVEHVRRLQPEGPYRLLGWSFGGVLAVELALQLARAGERIDALTCIDSYFAMRQACAAIGLPDVEDILDPINYHYLPSQEDLAGLSANLGDLVLFKAGERNDVVTGEHQRRLFDHYQLTPHNNLDKLLPAETIETRVLHGGTHHSWVQDDALVAAVCERVSALRSQP
ncbi:amino acid adenylation domain-containing protein [Amycolatopsis sp. lyj-346]|uniref:amino acid adenylation domain-containing protein n=1 Tax=Amycolatopsis sp. lyj-346 TaxID=2789289 RepID=UPI00397DE9F2